MKRFIVLAALFIVLTFAISQVSTASSVSAQLSGCWWTDVISLYIYPNTEVSFDIRFVNTSGLKIGGFSNGFRVWTIGGTPFTPVTAEVIHPDFESYFDLGHFINYFGSNKDTVGFGGAIISGEGIPIGFDDIVYRITTGGVQEGETLCIDSSYYPSSGTWRWQSGATSIYPDWSGPYCFLAETPMCIPSDISNPVEALNSECGFISYDFDNNGASIGHTFLILSGPGTINGSTGEWSYTIPPEESGTSDTLIIGYYDGCECGYDSCIVVLNFSSYDTTIDLNDDCSTDISDLVLVVQYMFNGGPPPVPLMAADMNADLQIDISDMVWIVNYMFNSGPPPM